MAARKLAGVGIELRIGSAVRAARLRQNNMAQAELARRCDVPRTYISKVENGYAHPTLRSLERMAAGLDIPVWKIVRFAEKREEAERRAAAGSAKVAAARVN